jgi:hypothetical protein
MTEALFEGYDNIETVDQKQSSMKTTRIYAENPNTSTKRQSLSNQNYIYSKLCSMKNYAIRVGRLFTSTEIGRVPIFITIHLFSWLR